MSDNINNLEKEYLAIKQKYLRTKNKQKGGESSPSLETEFTTKLWQKRYHDMRRTYKSQIDAMPDNEDFWKEKYKLAKNEYLNEKYDGNEMVWKGKYEEAKTQYLKLKSEM